MPEVFSALTDSIWKELPAADGDAKTKVAISTIRRNLQREHVARLVRMVLGPKRDASASAACCSSDFAARAGRRPQPGPAASTQIDERIKAALGQDVDAADAGPLAAIARADRQDAQGFLASQRAVARRSMWEKTGQVQSAGIAIAVGAGRRPVPASWICQPFSPPHLLKELNFEKFNGSIASCSLLLDLSHQLEWIFSFSRPRCGMVQNRVTRPPAEIL